MYSTAVRIVVYMYVTVYVQYDFHHTSQAYSGFEDIKFASETSGRLSCSGLAPTAVRRPSILRRRCGLLFQIEKNLWHKKEISATKIAIHL